MSVSYTKKNTTIEFAINELNEYGNGFRVGEEQEFREMIKHYFESTCNDIEEVYDLIDNLLDEREDDLSY